MYSLQKAYGVGVSMGSVWGDVDLSTLAVKQIYTQYREMYLVLTNPLITDPVNVKELGLLYLFISLIFVSRGAGRWSIDRFIK